MKRKLSRSACFSERNKYFISIWVKSVYFVQDKTLKHLSHYVSEIKKGDYESQTRGHAHFKSD